MLLRAVPRLDGFPYWGCVPMPFDTYAIAAVNKAVEHVRLPKMEGTQNVYATAHYERSF